MNVINHLDELRKRLIVTFMSFLLFFIIGFIFVKDIYQWFVQDLGLKLTVLGPSDILWIYFMLSGVIAVVGTIPIFAMQMWLFVKPALNPLERRAALTYIPALFLLFIIGLYFGYYVIKPVVLSFLFDLNGEMVATLFTADKYFRFILHMTLPFAVLFELPVVIMFLTSLGIINPYVLHKIRKYAYFVLVVVSVTISPPDFISDFLVTIPLLLLYEISIFFSKIIVKKKIKREISDESVR